MEPTDLNPPSREDDELKALLQSHAPALTLPDAGFSRRVLAALPPPRRHAQMLQLWLWLAGGLVGGLFAVVKGASFAELSVGSGALARSGAELLHAVSDPWLGLALALTGLSLLVGLAFVRGFGARA